MSLPLPATFDGVQTQLDADNYNGVRQPSLAVQSSRWSAAASTNQCAVPPESRLDGNAELLGLDHLSVLFLGSTLSQRHLILTTLFARVSFICAFSFNSPHWPAAWRCHISHETRSCALYALEECYLMMTIISLNRCFEIKSWR